MGWEKLCVTSGPFLSESASAFTGHIIDFTLMQEFACGEAPNLPVLDVHHARTTLGCRHESVDLKKASDNMPDPMPTLDLCR